MRTYIPKKRFTQEQFEKALSVPLAPFMEKRGYKLKRVGNEFHLVEHDSFVVTDNIWYWNSQNMRGNVISLLQKIENMDIVEAVLTLCDENTSNNEYVNPDFKEPEQKNKKIILPPHNANSRRVFAYLMKTRGIDKDIISDLIKQGKIYESREYLAKAQVAQNQYEKIKLVDGSTFVDLQYNNKITDTKEFQKGIMLGLNPDGKFKYAGILKLDGRSISEHLKNGSIRNVKEVHNCVFTGLDEKNIIKYASMRGITYNSSFRQDVVGSDKQYGFSMLGTSDMVYVFEAPIDALSHASLFKLCSLDWKKDSRISLGGVCEVALDKFLEQHPNIKKISFCLDNDRPGRNNVYGVYNEHKGRYEIRSLLKTYAEKGYEVYASFPATKDYNMDLMTYHKENRKENTDSEDDEYEEL